MTKSNQYLAAYYAVFEALPTKSKHAKLLKIRMATEDGTFKRHIDNLLDRLEDDLERYGSKNYYFFPVPDPIIQDLIEYLQFLLTQGKPEWQIIAEREGWSPPETRKRRAPSKDGMRDY